MKYLLIKNDRTIGFLFIDNIKSKETKDRSTNCLIIKAFGAIMYTIT